MIFLNIFISGDKMREQTSMLHFWGPEIHFFTLELFKTSPLSSKLMLFNQSQRLSLRQIKKIAYVSQIVFAFLCGINHLFSHIQKHEN